MSELEDSKIPGPLFYWMDKPKAIILDMIDFVVKPSFKKILVEFYQNRTRWFLRWNWHNEHVQRLVDAMYDDLHDKVRTHWDQEALELMLCFGGDERLKRRVAAHIERWVFRRSYADQNVDCEPMEQLIEEVVIYGFQEKYLKTRLYTDITCQLLLWRNWQIDFYNYCKSWQFHLIQPILSRTDHGTLNEMNCVDFNPTTTKPMGPISSCETFKSMLEVINESPNEVLFITRSIDEARIARQVGLRVYLIEKYMKGVPKVGEKYWLSHPHYGPRKPFRFRDTPEKPEADGFTTFQSLLDIGFISRRFQPVEPTSSGFCSIL